MVVLRPDPSIRRATEADIPAVMTLVGACIADMARRGIDQWDDIYPAQDHFSSDVAAGTLYAASSEDEDMVCIFALDGVQDPEYAAVPWTFLDEPVGVVHRLMVDPRFQGRGIARTTMVAAEGLAAGLGFAVVRLDAFSSNPPALRLYRKLGYHAAGDVVLRKGLFHCFEKRLRPRS